MKPVCTRLLGAVACIVLTACGASEGTSNTESAAATPTTTPASTTTVDSPPPDPDAAVEAGFSESGLFLVDDYDPERDPTQDIEAAVLRAADESKEVVAVVGGDWCPDCWYLDGFLEANDDLMGDLTDAFYFVKVNISDENENGAFLARYPSFDWVPHLFVFGPDGELVDSVDTRILMDDGRFDDDAFAEFVSSRSTG